MRANRPLDKSGRLCIPKEIRDAASLIGGEHVSMEVNGDRLIIRSLRGELDDLRSALEEVGRSSE